jgi:acetyl esterase/lipase
LGYCVWFINTTLSKYKEIKVTFEELLDPDVAPALEMIPAEMITAIGEDPLAAREMFGGMLEEMASMLPPTEVSVEERMIPGPDGDIRVVIYQPPVEAPRPGLLWVHGGGYVIGDARDDASCIPHAEHTGCTIVSVDYRMAPEHPFPAGPEDCHAGLLWMVENAEELGVDTERLAIGGASAGSGMAAGVALMNRDRGGPQLSFQLLIYPMIDDTHETPSGHSVTHPNVWNRDVSLKAWKMYLGDAYGGDVSPYAAASRATDVSNLPPTYICVGTMDLFRDEDIEYARRLLAAGVPTELQVYPGCFHGSEAFAPEAAVSQRMRQGYIDALKRALA